MAREREFESVFLVLAALFIASLVVCNLIVQKFFLWEPFGIEDYFFLLIVLFHILGTIAISPRLLVGGGSGVE